MVYLCTRTEYVSGRCWNDPYELPMSGQAFVHQKIGERKQAFLLNRGIYKCKWLHRMKTLIQSFGTRPNVL